MNKNTSSFTTTHYAAAAFTAAFFSIIAVLAVIGGTASGEANETDAVAAETLAELDTNTTDEAVRPNRNRPPRRGPAGRQGPPSFEDFDGDGDGNITRIEFDEFRASHRPPGPRGPQRHARGDFDSPPRGPRGGEHGEFGGGPRGGRGHGEFRGGPGGERGHRGPPPHIRGQGRGEHQQGPPPRHRDGEGPRGPRAGGPGDFNQRPPRPDFNQIDADGDGSISEQEFNNFRPPRSPRGRGGDRREFPREESF